MWTNALDRSQDETVRAMIQMWEDENRRLEEEKEGLVVTPIDYRSDASSSSDSWCRRNCLQRLFCEIIVKRGMKYESPEQRGIF